MRLNGRLLAESEGPAAWTVPLVESILTAMKTVFDVAVALARAHREEDPATTDVFVAEDADEVRLVEVSDSLVGSLQRDVLPFRFIARPDKGVFYPSVVVLLSPSEWAAVQKGELNLPAGWDKDKLRRVV